MLQHLVITSVDKEQLPGERRPSAWALKEGRRRPDGWRGQAGDTAGRNGQ